MNTANNFINRKLNERREAGNYRQLKPENDLIDFCSNDYLGFARSEQLAQWIEAEVKQLKGNYNGSTGSRLISGNTAYTELLEVEIAAYHNSPAGLLFNSGYDANLGLFSSLPQRGDTVITDELIHASIIDGCRLSHANRYIFKHNDLSSLEEKLKHAKGIVYVAVESIYSMDGDAVSLADIIELTQRYDAHLIVDEAHAVGLYPKGIVCSLGLEKDVFARVVTFGKALGCHGAIVLGSANLRNYLVNFARSFIYTTASNAHHQASIKMAYKMLAEAGNEIENLKHNITLFKQKLSDRVQQYLIASDSPVQCIVVGGNEKAAAIAAHLQNNGMDVRPIFSPTVAAGHERIRICLHSFNAENEIYLLADQINQFFNAF